MREHTFRPIGGDQVAVMTGESGYHGPSCFADEVGIDFPSMSPAVDRIRSGLVAEERPAPVPAYLRLSHRAACDGTTAPLEVPVRSTCRLCGGRGESWGEGCGHCGGRGSEYLRHQLQVTIPPGVTDGSRFYFTVTPRRHPATRIELRIVVEGLI